MFLVNVLYRAVVALVMLVSTSAVSASTIKYDFSGVNSSDGGFVNGQVSFHFFGVVTPDTTPRADLVVSVSGGAQDGRYVALTDFATRITRTSSGEGFYGLLGRDSFLIYGERRTAADQIIDAASFFDGFVWVGNPPNGGQSVAATRYSISELSVVENTFVGPAAVPVPTSLSLMLLAFGSLGSLALIRGHTQFSRIHTGLGVF